MREPWWRGTRGEWYVAGQVAIMALLFLGPRTLPGLPPWPAAIVRACGWAGAILLLGGGALFAWGLLGLGRSLTPLPAPRADAELVQTGPYRFVRHPIYAGGIALAFGWALLARGWLTLAWAAVLLVYLDVKSAREERWLLERYPAYAAYRRRVRKLIPFLY